MSTFILRVFFSSCKNYTCSLQVMQTGRKKKRKNTHNKDTDLLENGLEDMGRGKGKM